MHFLIFMIGKVTQSIQILNELINKFITILYIDYQVNML